LKLGAAFERKLSRIIINKLKSTFDPLKDINFDALGKEKTCVRRLIDKAMSPQKRLFIHWAT
jgi:hypothetical protein